MRDGLVGQGVPQLEPPPPVGGEVETVTQEPPQGPGSINTDGEHSLLNFLDHKLREFVAALPDELLLMPDSQLKNEVRPTSTDYSLRTSFWREYEKAAWKGTGKIRAMNVYAGICTDQYFYSKFMKNPKKLAWMVRPMQNYVREMEALNARGNERLWEMLEMKITDKLNRVDARKAEVLLKIISEIKNRTHGMVVHKVEKTSRSVSLSIRGQTSQPAGAASAREVDAEIARMEGEIIEAERASLPTASGETGQVFAARGQDRVPEAARAEEVRAPAAGALAGAAPAPVRGSTRRYG